MAPLHRPGTRDSEVRVVSLPHPAQAPEGLSVRLESGSSSSARVSQVQHPLCFQAGRWRDTNEGCLPSRRP